MTLPHFQRYFMFKRWDLFAWIEEYTHGSPRINRKHALDVSYTVFIYRVSFSYTK